MQCTKRFSAKGNRSGYGPGCRTIQSASRRLGQPLPAEHPDVQDRRDDPARSSHGAPFRYEHRESDQCPCTLAELFPLLIANPLPYDLPQVAVQTRAMLNGPRGHFLLGNLPEISKDQLGFLLNCARSYGDRVELRFGRRRIVVLNNPRDIEEV